MFHGSVDQCYIIALACPCCVFLLSGWGHSLPFSNITVNDNNLNTCQTSLFLSPSLHSLLLQTSLYLCDPISSSYPPSPPLPSSLSVFLPLPPLMVTLLSDCYISSHGKSAVGAVSSHYANDGQFNFGWSEGECLIRGRRGTQRRTQKRRAGEMGTEMQT